MSFTRHAMGIRTNTLPEDTREEVRAELAKRAAASFARVREGRSFEEAGPPSAAASKKKRRRRERERERERRRIGGDDARGVAARVSEQCEFREGLRSA